MFSAISMWKNTRMIVFVAVVAAFYATAQIVLDPLNFTVIPGVVSFKVSNIFTMFLGIIFGPAGAWGLGVGNAIGDFFTGNLALGSIFGFLSTFAVGFVGYTFWTWFRGQVDNEDPPIRTWRDIALYVLTGLVAAVASGVVLGWGLNLLGLAPFQLISNILVVNFGIANVVGIVLYFLLFSRIKSMGSYWTDIMDSNDIGKPKNARLGALLVIIGSFTGWLLGAFVLQGTLITPIVGICFALIVVGAYLL